MIRESCFEHHSIRTHEFRNAVCKEGRRPTMWYAGIDWADQHHDVVVLDEGAKMVKAIRVQHNAQGMEQLDTFLQQISGPANKEQMACIIETNQGLLISMLLEKGWPVYP